MAKTWEEGEIWGTWEELLLACAVNRHGPHSWDSVAMELRSRTTPSYAHRLTPDLCRNHYRHLHLRFTGGDGTDGSDQTREEDPTAKIPWLDELRKLRVAELRQALDRSDVSIGTLQLKVKRLKEERERSLKEPESAGCDGRSGSDPIEKDKRKDRIGSPGLVPGGGSGGSCREYNSTEKKPEEPDPDPKGVTGSGSDRVVGEASYNGSTGDGAVRSPAEEANPVNESGESVAETKESSDVQSSACLPRRRRRQFRRRMPAATVASDEPGTADAVSSPVRDPVDSESQPLISFLDMIRSTEHGLVFERRLESQESVRYGSIIRRHVDLEIIQCSIGRSGYTSSELFRDLLLLCTNATVYFPKSSRESIAAVHIRDLVTREISTLREPTVPSPPSDKEQTSPPAQHFPSVLPKSDPKPNTPPDKKPVAPLPPLVACRKRSSITAKHALKKTEKPMQELIIDEKDKGDKMKKTKKKALPEFIIDENENEEKRKRRKQKKKKKKKKKKEEEEEGEVVVKKTTKQQRSVLGRGLRAVKTRSGSKVAAKNQSIPTTEAPKEETELKTESETKPLAAKKRSVANFLNRLKRSTPSSSNGALLLDDLKTAASGRGSDHQKKKSCEESRKGKEKDRESTAVKRTVGRPPKRAADSPAKRWREEKTLTPTTVKKRART